MIDMGMIKEIDSLYGGLSMVSTTIKRIEMYILRSGLTIKARGSKSYSFDTSSEKDKQLFEADLYPAVVKVIHHFLLYGFCCVSIAPSQYVEGAYTLHVLPWDLIVVSFQINDYLQREYKIELRNTTDNTPETKGLIDMAQFIYMDEPDDYGRVTSPIAQCIGELQQYRKLRNDYALASHRLVRPIPIFKQASDPLAAAITGTGGQGVTQMLRKQGVAPAGLGDEPTSVVFHQAEERKNKAVRQGVSEALSLRQAISSSSSSSSSTKKLEKIYDDPLNDMYIEPAGQSIEPALKYATPAELRPMMAVYENNFKSACGIPNEENIYATSMSVDAYLRQMNMYIVGFHRKVEHCLARPLSMLFKGKVFYDIIEKSIDDDTERALESGEDLDNDKLKEAMDKQAANVTVTIEFSTNPLTTFELLTQYFHEGVIPYEQYVAHSLDYAGIQPWEGSGKRTMYADQQQEIFEKQERAKRPPEEAKQSSKKAKQQRSK